MPMRQNLSRMTAEEAESLIFNGAMVAVGGLTPAGAPGRAAGAGPARPGVAQGRHRDPAQAAEGASTGTACDDSLAQAEAVSWRAHCMTSAPMREPANAGKLESVDMHLSHDVQAALISGQVSREGGGASSPGRDPVETGICRPCDSLREQLQVIRRGLWIVNARLESSSARIALAHRRRREATGKIGHDLSRPSTDPLGDERLVSRSQGLLGRWSGPTETRQAQLAGPPGRASSGRRDLRRLCLNQHGPGGRAARCLRPRESRRGLPEFRPLYGSAELRLLR